MECDVCKSRIKVGQNLYSCDLDEEFLEDRCYTVSNAYAFVFICEKCLEHFDPVVEINSRLLDHHRSSSKSTNKNKISAIHNMYDCQKCDKPIRDGEKIVTVNHSFETRKENSIQPYKTDIAYLLCKPCAVASEIEQNLEEIVKTILPIAKQAIFRPLGE